MAAFPDTRLSLIARLQTGADTTAWAEFVEVYWPVVYRLARHRGLQHADAEDLAQQVLLAVARAVERWQPDESRARFRTWLGRIAENLTINMLARRPRDGSPGAGADQGVLDERAAGEEVGSALLRLEYRREVFHWAAQQIRPEFQPETWQAFWLTAVQGLAVEDAGRVLKKNPGSIYASRSRVMRRLRDKVQEWADPE